MTTPEEVHADLLTRCHDVHTIDRLDQEDLDHGLSSAFGVMVLDATNGTMLAVECGIGDRGNAFAVISLYDETGAKEKPEVLDVADEVWVTTAR